MGNIYFVRHWQTDRNLKKMMNPWDVDSLLNDTWVQQAISAGQKAFQDNITFDIIISSPLKRALDTAKIIAKEVWYTWEILLDNRLKEQFAWKFKDYTHTQLKEEFNIESDEEIRRLFKSKEYNQIEDILEFSDRVTEVYKEIIQKYQEKNILIVGHSGVARIILMNSEKLDFQTAVYEADSTPNATIIKLSK